MTEEADYGFQGRDAALNFPVPVLSPTQTNKAIAFDVAPKGNPDDYSRFGKAWFHVCDIDIHANDAAATKGPLRCVGMGAHSEYTWIGCDGFHGASQLPLNITYGGAVNLQLTPAGMEAKTNLFVGTTSPTAGVGNSSTGISMTPLGDFRVSRHNAPSVFNRNLSGTIIQLRHNGNLVGEINVASDGVTLSGFKQIDDLAARVAALEAQ